MVRGPAVFPARVLIAAVTVKSGFVMLGSPDDLMSILLQKHLARVLQCKPFLISISQHHDLKRLKITYNMVPFL